MSRVLLAFAIACAGCSFTPGLLVRDATPTEDVAPAIDAAPDAPLAAPFALTGAWWLLPCQNDLGNNNCNCPPPTTTTVTLGGMASTRWTVTVRIRGVMEAIGYNGGSAGTGGWYEGGNANDASNNIYRLDVSSPARRFWINRGTPTGMRSFLYDYEESFQIDGGATVTFYASGQDTLQWGNYDANDQPLTIAGLTEIMQPYDGQFAHLEVVSATEL